MMLSTEKTTTRQKDAAPWDFLWLTWLTIEKSVAEALEGQRLGLWALKINTHITMSSNNKCSLKNIPAIYYEDDSMTFQDSSSF